MSLSQAGAGFVTALAEAVTAAAGYRLGDTDCAAIGAFAGPYLAAMLDRSADELLRGDRADRAENMLKAAGESSGLSPEQLAELASQNPRTRFLTDAALRAAADTFWPPSVRALGRALAAGLIQAEDTVIDIPKMVLPAMTPDGRHERAVAGRDHHFPLGSHGNDSRAQRIDTPETAHLANIKSEWTPRK